MIASATKVMSILAVFWARQALLLRGLYLCEVGTYDGYGVALATSSLFIAFYPVHNGRGTPVF